MSQKPDYYEVLGVAKTAPVDEIKKAFKSIAMKCHPDMVRNKANMTPVEKEAAIERYKLAQEASDVLTDATKRSTYDRYGHKGLENIKDSGASGRQSYTDAAGPVTPRKAYTEEDTFSFFEKRTGSGDSKPTTSGASGETSEQRRERLRQERVRAREEARRGKAPDVADDFKEVAEKVEDAAERLKEVVLPLDVLQDIRDKAMTVVKVADAAIERARKNGGPQL